MDVNSISWERISTCPAFLARLRRCVNWLNEKQGDALLTACTNQKDRARDVIERKGAKTKW